MKNLAQTVMVFCLLIPVTIALDLQSTTNDCRLMDAVKFLLDNAHRRGEWLKGELEAILAERMPNRNFYLWL